MAGCLDMPPSNWQPRIPRSALITDIAPGSYEEMMQSIQPQQFIEFPPDKPLPDEVFPSENPENSYACIKESEIFIELRVSNPNRYTTIRLDNIPVVRLISSEEFTSTMHAFFFLPEGGIPFRDYEVSLAPSRTGSVINTTPMEGTDTIAEYSLKPGDDTEIFRIFMKCPVPGKYKLQVGVNQKVNNTVTTIWSDNFFEVFSPSRYYSWSFNVSNNGSYFGLLEYNARKEDWENKSGPESIDLFITED
jgi:hypothetical protein